MQHIWRFFPKCTFCTPEEGTGFNRTIVIDSCILAKYPKGTLWDAVTSGITEKCKICNTLYVVSLKRLSINFISNLLS